MSERCYDVLRPSDVRAGLDGSTWGTTSQSRSDRPSEGLARARASRNRKVGNTYDEADDRRRSRDLRAAIEKGLESPPRRLTSPPTTHPP